MGGRGEGGGRGGPLKPFLRPDIREVKKDQNTGGAIL